MDDTQYHGRQKVSPDKHYNQRETAALLLNEHWQIIACNEASLRLFGFVSSSQLVNRHPAQLSPPQQPCGNTSLQKSIKMLELTREQGENTFEWVHINQQGEPLSSYVQLTRLNGAGPLYILAHVLPIQSLPVPQRAPHLQGLFYQYTTDGIMLTDVACRITDVNPAFERITGFRRQEVLGREAGFMKSGLHDRYFYQQMWQTIRQSNQWLGEVWDKNSAGELLPKKLRIIAIKNAHNAVQSYLGIFSDSTEQYRQRKKLEHLAFYDALTDLPNRRFIQQLLQDRIDAGQSPFVLASIDVDKFKVINDHGGHHKGDEILKLVARVLKNGINNTDIVGRISGDEFMILFQQSVPITHIIQRLQRINDTLNRLPSLPISLSIGLSTYPEHGNNAKHLVRRADIAMYHSKNAGGNRIVVFENTLEVLFKEKLQRERTIQALVRNQRCFFHYQPIIELATLGIECFETLVRLPHPECKTLNPSSFINGAEQQGLISELSLSLFTEAFTFLADPNGIANVALNVSSDHLLKADFVESLESLRLQHAIDAQKITLEITESCLIRNFQHSAEVLNALRQIGYRIAIDDFGTGYSSLSYLKNLAVDEIKIDRSFIQNLTGNFSRNDLIVQSIIELSHRLGLTVVAEGVETCEQLNILRTLRCDKVQGFLFSPALNANDASCIQLSLKCPPLES